MAPVLEVACISVGDFYGPEYVEHLQWNVHRHLPVEHEFVCYTDGPIIPGVDCRPPLLPIEDAPGWWQKVGLFKPGRPDTLFFDLDVIPIHDLSPLADWSRPFGAWKDPWQKGINSSVMLIHSGGAPEVFTKFRPEWAKAMYGDQDWINHVLPKAPPFHGEWIKSYKVDNMVRPPNGCTRVIAFHGVPKPDDFRADHWVSKMWRGEAPLGGE